MMDFSSVTEQPGIGVTHEALEMLHARYSFAASHCEGKDVLEVACGAGMGLGLLAKSARRLVGGDFSESLLQCARRHYGSRVRLIRFDAHALPFADASFDTVLVFEAIYYFESARRFLNECHRVLRPGGILLVCSANRRSAGFNRSPFSNRYFAEDELRDLLIASRFAPELYGAFPSSPKTGRDRAIASLRNLAIRLHLVPRTMKGKEILKRLFYGRLSNVSHEIENKVLSAAFLHRLSAKNHRTDFKVLYAVAHR
jgi:ubiquinone/menaquinone biosynthesis C-methylase UbiE